MSPLLKLSTLALVLTLGCGAPDSSAKVTPRPEDCANRRDDNGDGKTDCADPLCFLNAGCTGPLVGGDGGSAGGAGGGAGGGCAIAFAQPSQATDQQLWDCGIVPGRLGACSVSTCTTGCSCTSYVRSSQLCATGTCSAPLSGTGCSDKSYYTGAPFSCSGSMVAQSACMLRYLIVNGFCL